MRVSSLRSRIQRQLNYLKLMQATATHRLPAGTPIGVNEVAGATTRAFALPRPAYSTHMHVRSAATLFLLLLTSPLAAQSDEAFVVWARGRAVTIDESGKAFRTLDGAIGKARLIGVGESVHEAEPFTSFRLQLLQDLVRRHRVTALVLESGLPEAMAVDDYVRGRTAAVDFDAALPGGLGALVEIRRTMEWLREWNLGEGRRRPVGVYGADLPGRSGTWSRRWIGFRSSPRGMPRSGRGSIPCGQWRCRRAPGGGRGPRKSTTRCRRMRRRLSRPM